MDSTAPVVCSSESDVDQGKTKNRSAESTVRFAVLTNAFLQRDDEPRT